jgi:hypothetical protein
VMRQTFRVEFASCLNCRSRGFSASAPPWPGDPVLVMDSEQTRPSRMVWPRFLPYLLRSKLPTWIADVATTGNSGSGVFDPNRKCLLGIMSRKYIAADKDIAKYFVPAAQIREFVDKL